MGVSPTEPLGSVAAEFTFELDEILTVFGTVLNRNLATVRAN